MKTFMVILACLVIATGLMAAPDTEEQTKIDTLITEPHEADDLPEAVVAWLETRDLLIPLPWEEGLPVVPGAVESNTITGSFIKAGQQDIAVLTVSKGAIDDSCKLWVFPKSDTLEPVVIGSQKGNFYPGSRWWPVFGNKSQLRYAWRISPLYPQEYILIYKERTVDAETLPELTCDGIRIWIGDKMGGSFYYFDGEKWIHMSYLGC
ncbi:MAG: hypothetical protein FVQ81_15910 [Candidatus Glassbacteria bacterium]|nr:hypothetical protein [Candidatus Glassbacteria bacterium]